MIIKKNEIILETNDWDFEERLSKEFEAVGFFISNHPLNQYKEVFKDYKIIDFQSFNNNDERKRGEYCSDTSKNSRERKLQKEILMLF